MKIIKRDINIISANVTHYHHLHTDYGMIGEDAHGGGAAHNHSSIPSTHTLITVAYAQSSDGHTDHAHGPASTGEDALTFNQKDLRIRFAFPEQGMYKVFFEFATVANPSLVQRAEFWIQAEAPLPSGGINLPKWLLVLLSVILISAVMPFIYRYLNEDRIKV